MYSQIPALSKAVLNQLKSPSSTATTRVQTHLPFTSVSHITRLTRVHITSNVGNDDKTPTALIMSGYNYGVISSLVLTADRSALPNQDNEPDAPSRTTQCAAPKDLDKKKKKATDKQDPSECTAKQKQEATGFGYTNILKVTQDIEGLTYRPCTAETRNVTSLLFPPSILHSGTKLRTFSSIPQS
ncbi:hypothetical protein BGY98DRAFT_986463 [Russula aff. rugulosa BPL654]|nr:hypothetical protein BGY98DRAFT_986463 [Russula aff. rugulosa BPL654]